LRSVWPAVQPLSRTAGSGAKAPPPAARAKRNAPRSQVLAPQRSRKGDDVQKGRHTVQAHAEEDRTGSRLTNAEKEGMERSEERGNGGRVMGGRGTKRKGAGLGREEKVGEGGEESGRGGGRARSERGARERRKVGRREGEVEEGEGEAFMWEGHEEIAVLIPAAIVYGA